MNPKTHTPLTTKTRIGKFNETAIQARLDAFPAQAKKTRKRNRHKKEDSGPKSRQWAWPATGVFPWSQPLTP
jgi:hypothetical protein